jgi:hypothetical protein
MNSRKKPRRADRAPRRRPVCPTEAHLILSTGEKVSCTIVEDPELDSDGLRLFWLEPVREITESETITSAWVDRIPPRSKIRIQWNISEETGPDGRVSWTDEQGRHTRHTRRIEGS